jgi:ABC-type transport system involved in multi-copper enzyme maturation permease subunit
MTLSWRRLRAIEQKELREFRRNRSVVVTMAIFPLIFLIQPLVVLLRVPGSEASTLGQMHLLLYMLAIPVLVPATVAATAVTGERQQGTLEPALSTPIRREEFILGKALAALIPSILIAYVVYALFIACAFVLAAPAVTSAIMRGPDLLAQFLFTPFLALWSIWVGLAISTRSSDVRVAQQLSLLGCLPVVLLTSLIAFDVIPASLGLGLVLGAALLLADALGWRFVSQLFDRERLITGTP